MKGSIVKKGATYFAIVETSTINPVTGKAKRKRKWFKADGAKNKAEAQTFLRTKLTELEGGILIDAKKISVADYLDRWLDTVKPNVSPKTHQRYTEVCRKTIGPRIGTVILSKLIPPQISAAYTEALTSGRRKHGTGGLSPRTVHHMHTILKGALAQAVEWSLLARNPCDAVRPPKVEKKPMMTFDLQQTAQAIEAVRPSRLFIPAMLALLCGMRRGEIAGLRWRNVDLTTGKLSVVESAEQTGSVVRYKEPKTGKGRSIALGSTIIDELKAWRLKQAQEFLKLGMRPSDETFVCTQADGSPHQPNNLTHRWSLIIRGTSLPHIRFHDLRHTHATLLLQQGVHPKIASERLGHTKIGITLDLYSHVLPGMQDEAVAKVDAALKSVLQPTVAS
jgi:integrase